MDTLLFDVFSVFDTHDTASDFQPIIAGHINHTYAVLVFGEEKPKYILQKINTDIFKNPDQLISNIKGVCAHIRNKVIEREGDPLRETLTLIPTKDGRDYYHHSEHGALAGLLKRHRLTPAVVPVVSEARTGGGRDKRPRPAVPA